MSSAPVCGGVRRRVRRPWLKKINKLYFIHGVCHSKLVAADRQCLRTAAAAANDDINMQ